MSAASQELVKAKLAVQVARSACAESAYWMAELWTNVSYAHRENDTMASRSRLQRAEERYWTAVGVLVQAEFALTQLRKDKSWGSVS